MTEARLGRLKHRAAGRWSTLKARHVHLQHVVAAWNLMQRNHANQYAAAITYFSFLAIFPLLLLGVSLVGFVLHSDPEAERRLYAHIAANFPGQFGSELTNSLHHAVDARASIGLVGLVGVLLTGLGWIANLRQAIDAVWGRPPASRNFAVTRLINLVVLAGLGLGALISIGFTAIGTSLTEQILRAAGLDDLPGSVLVLKALGIALGVAGDIVIFWWLLVRLPAVDVHPRVALRGAALTAVGFEVLKIAGTFTIAHTSSSPTAGPFAGVVAVLIWIQLVARWLLFCCAWIATVHASQQMANKVPVVEPEVMRVDDTEPVVTPAAVSAALLGVGAVLGAATTVAMNRSRPTGRRVVP